MVDETMLERFSRKGRRTLFVILGLAAVVIGGGIWIAVEVGGLAAGAWVIAMSMLVGFIFPRLV